MYFKIQFLLLTLFALTDALSAGTRVPNELAKIRSVGIQTQVYSTLNEGKLPSSWSDFIEFDSEFRSLVELKVEGTRISALYSFISEEDRSKFPDGELLLIRHQPTDWPDIWKQKVSSIDPSKLTKGQHAELERLASRQQPIRYLVYRNESGNLDSVWWFEEDVQKMLAETGIRVPKPEPYQAPAVAAVPSAPAPEAVQVVEEVTPPELAIKEPAEVAPVEVVEETPEQSSQWWLWLVGLLVVVGGLALVVRRKS